MHSAVFAVCVSCQMALLRALLGNASAVSLLNLPLILYHALAGEAQKLLQQLRLSVLLTVPRQIC